MTHKSEENLHESNEEEEVNKSLKEDTTKVEDNDEERFISLKELKERHAGQQPEKQGNNKEQLNNDRDELKSMLRNDDDEEDYITDDTWGKTEEDQEEEDKKRESEIKELEGLLKKLKVISQFYEA